MDIALKANNLKELDEYLPEDEKKQANCEVFLSLSMKNLNLKSLNKIDKLFEPYKNLKRLVLLFNPKDYQIPRQQLADALDFQVDKKLDIAFEDVGFGYFNIGQVYASMEKIYKYSDFIIEKNLSPLEALLYAYYVATDKPYKEVEKGGDLRDSRSVYSIMFNDKIVCLGYCNLIKAIISNTNTKNIQIFDNTTMTSVKNKIDLHATLIVYVKDDKYKIDGYYFLEPTMDRELRQYKRAKNRSFYINNFMIPLSDIKFSRSVYKEAKYRDYYTYDNDEEAGPLYKAEFYDTSLKFSQDSFVINKDFEKALEKNEKIMSDLMKKYNIDLTKTKFEKISKNAKILEGVLLENSEPIPLDVLINVSYKVFNAMEIFPTKDQNFYFTKQVINGNITGNEFYFNKGAKNEISVCEEGYKL